MRHLPTQISASLSPTGQVDAALVGQHTEVPATGRHPRRDLR